MGILEVCSSAEARFCIFRVSISFWSCKICKSFSCASVCEVAEVLLCANARLDDKITALIAHLGALVNVIEKYFIIPSF